MIEKVKYDKQFPYILRDAWGGKVCLTEEDLVELQKEIAKILKREG